MEIIKSLAAGRPRPDHRPCGELTCRGFPAAILIWDCIPSSGHPAWNSGINMTVALQPSNGHERRQRLDECVRERPLAEQIRSYGRAAPADDHPHNADEGIRPRPRAFRTSRPAFACTCGVRGAPEGGGIFSDALEAPVSPPRTRAAASRQRTRVRSTYGEERGAADRYSADVLQESPGHVPSP